MRPLISLALRAPVSPVPQIASRQAIPPCRPEQFFDKHLREETFIGASGPNQFLLITHFPDDHWLSVIPMQAFPQATLNRE